MIRNRLRRLIKEVFRLHRKNVREGVQLVVVARVPLSKVARAPGAYRIVERSLVGLLSRASVYTGGELP